MSENAATTEEPLETPGETPEPPVEFDDGVREISPIVWLEDPDIEENMFDFRPVNVIDVEDEEEIYVAPKASPAAEPADSSAAGTATPATPASAVKDSGQPKASGSGTPAS